MAQAAGVDAAVQDPTMQYVVLRKDLWMTMGWPLGSVVAQACHASSAAIWLSREDPITVEYLAPENLDSMRKVVLECVDEAALRALAAKLDAAGIACKLWIEQPEDIATCLATCPSQKSRMATLFKKLPLCKAVLGKS
eukprot:CAMPEP_0119107840 /NCGR_PEP_ID=MMETSP1180-20130426/11828_1 /TAXON_ID=3052 ORGANISM="Chlamydomonas cf sp, Strain CCMP681" /NCGR_SAMPLE_ID=MMETSP1180 /ASSEMBLY_ACC=CAM_ASM_000741 /LENGTH=137 /DNA_ID=CAMNT_0007093385 /DNA_START=105 /DNA_END=518 /DNA_ORIENTATION=-